MSGPNLTKAQDDIARKIAHGHTDLTVFHAVIKIMEGGCLYDPKSHAAAVKVIAICKQQAARSLRMLDSGRAALNASKGE